MDKKFKLVISVAASLLFGCCTVFAGEVGRVPMTLTIVDDTMKPLSGATISGTFTKGVESGGLFSTSTKEEAEPLKCVTDDYGVCKASIPLTKDKKYNWLKIAGQIIEITLASGAKLELNDKNRNLDIYLFGDKTFDRRIYLENGKARIGGKWVVVPMADVKALLSVADDDLDTEAKVSTQPTRALWREDSVISNITFIRVWVHKSNGSRRFQIYSHIDYDDADWRSYTTVNYQTPTGPQSAVLTEIASKPYHWGKDLRRYEDVAFEVPETLLRQVAAKYIDGSDATLNYRLFAQSGGTENFSIPIFEVAGLLAKVDDLLKKYSK